MLLFSWKKSNQKFKAAPASLLRWKTTLEKSETRFAQTADFSESLRLSPSRTLTRRRPVRERKAFFGDGRYRHLYNTTGVFDFNRRYRQSKEEAPLPMKGVSWRALNAAAGVSVRSIRCLSEASSEATANVGCGVANQVQPWSFGYFWIKPKVGSYFSTIEPNNKVKTAS